MCDGRSTFVLLPASGSLLVREIFGTKLTRTGSIAPSVRHKMSRKSDSPFAFFNKKASNQLTRSVSAISEVHLLYVHTHYHINVPTCTMSWALAYYVKGNLLTC